MCPDISGLTCYVGNYNLLLQGMAAVVSLGAVFGAMVGIIVYVIKQRL